MVRSSHEDSFKNFTAKLNRFKNALGSNTDSIISQSIFEGQPEKKDMEFFLKRLDDLKDYNNFKNEFIKVITEMKLVSELDIRLETFGVTIDKVSKDLHKKVLAVLNEKITMAKVLKVNEDFHNKNRTQETAENGGKTIVPFAIEGYTGDEYMEPAQGKPKPTQEQINSAIKKAVRDNELARKHAQRIMSNSISLKESTNKDKDNNKPRLSRALGRSVQSRLNSRKASNGMPPINITLSNIGNIGSGGQPGVFVNPQSLSTSPAQVVPSTTTENRMGKNGNEGDEGNKKTADLEKAIDSFGKEKEKHLKQN